LGGAPAATDSCGRPLLLPADGHIDALAVFGDGFWSLSRDGGATWEPPRSDRFSARVLVPSPAVEQDHSVFIEAWDAPTGGYRALGVAVIPLR